MVRVLDAVVFTAYLESLVDDVLGEPSTKRRRLARRCVATHVGDTLAAARRRRPTTYRRLRGALSVTSAGRSFARVRYAHGRHAFVPIRRAPFLSAMWMLTKLDENVREYLVALRAAEASPPSTTSEAFVDAHHAQLVGVYERVANDDALLFAA